MLWGLGSVSGLITLPWMIHNNISMAWSLVFIPMVPHPPAAPSSFSKAGTKTLLALPFPQVLPSYLQVTINCPLHKHARRRLQTKHPLLFPSIPIINSGWHRGAHRRLPRSCAPRMSGEKKTFKLFHFRLFLCCCAESALWRDYFCRTSVLKCVAPFCPDPTVNCRRFFHLLELLGAAPCQQRLRTVSKL